MHEFHHLPRLDLEAKIIFTLEAPYQNLLNIIELFGCGAFETMIYGLECEGSTQVCISTSDGIKFVAADMNDTIIRGQNEYRDFKFSSSPDLSMSQIFNSAPNLRLVSITDRCSIAGMHVGNKFYGVLTMLETRLICADCSIGAVVKLDNVDDITPAEMVSRLQEAKILVDSMIEQVPNIIAGMLLKARTQNDNVVKLYCDEREVIVPARGILTYCDVKFHDESHILLPRFSRVVGFELKALLTHGHLNDEDLSPDECFQLMNVLMYLGVAI